MPLVDTFCQPEAVHRQRSLQYGLTCMTSYSHQRPSRGHAPFSLGGLAGQGLPELGAQSGRERSSQPSAVEAASPPSSRVEGASAPPSLPKVPIALPPQLARRITNTRGALLEAIRMTLTEAKPMPDGRPLALRPPARGPYARSVTLIAVPLAPTTVRRDRLSRIALKRASGPCESVAAPRRESLEELVGECVAGTRATVFGPWLHGAVVDHSLGQPVFAESADVES
jgi:hypothetical protein